MRSENPFALRAVCSLSEGEANGEHYTLQVGIMLLFMTIVLIHNMNIPLTLCRGAQNWSRHKLFVGVPLVCDSKPGSK